MLAYKKRLKFSHSLTDILLAFDLKHSFLVIFKNGRIIFFSWQELALITDACQGSGLAVLLNE